MYFFFLNFVRASKRHLLIHMLCFCARNHSGCAGTADVGEAVRKSADENAKICSLALNSCWALKAACATDVGEIQFRTSAKFGSTLRSSWFQPELLAFGLGFEQEGKKRNRPDKAVFERHRSLLVARAVDRRRTVHRRGQARHRRLRGGHAMPGA